MPLSDVEAEAIADRVLAASDRVASIPPISVEHPEFDLADGYRVSAAVTRKRIARGERPVGWKVGFTNETIWDEYDVHAPIWGPMYDSTLVTGDPASGPLDCPIGALVEPRIEPEIAFRISVPPRPDMEESELLHCVDAVAHGFEIVQSLFPGWRFKAADTVAAFALHGRYVCGPLLPVRPADRPRWLEALADFRITLFRDGSRIDSGVGRNVLGGGPVRALCHVVRGMAAFPGGGALKAGDLVTTGTLTRAFPVLPGECWSTEIEGLPLPGMRLALR